MPQVHAWGAAKAGAPLAPMTIERRAPGPHDVVLEVLFCGVCHSDIHQVRDEWTGGLFPMVPGHEVVGRVIARGSAATKFELGALAGVGCMVDSCRRCGPCHDHEEQFCEAGSALTYNGTEMDRQTPTFGGYSTQLVVSEDFAVRIPDGLDPAAAAPLLCAGITTYSPLRQWKVKAGDRVGVIGLGGLGHMAVKLAVSMGAAVTVFSTSAGKEADARRLGATGFVVSTPEALGALAGRFDFLLDTVSAEHDYNAFLNLLRPRGAMVLVGAPATAAPVHPFSLIMGSRILAGSAIGGIAETQEMLDHCAAHGIVSDIELIPIEQINAAYERVLKSDVRYRFVIDVSTLRDPAA
jgi:uncharacterized zinc-type alcohol dehydrogenase-like protein